MAQKSVSELDRVAQAIWDAGPTTYLASPYTHFPREQGGRSVAQYKAARAAGWLMERGVSVFCPVAMGHSIALASNWAGEREKPSEWWVGKMLPFVLQSHSFVILMITGWNDPRSGIQRERDEAEANQRPIFHLPDPFEEKS